ncbi:hypothetical protein SASPL_112215 [Salvia splendens]|uniref:Uncharacterized protein n=1 Tax=Salvia splendens TaxID=180675 RepID=A0A8X9A335_SALSN|nr:hypothetical protein SASPL_112215 [Salvia splendens]
MPEAAMMQRIFLLALALNVVSTSYAAMDSNVYVVHMDKSKMRAFDVSVGTSRRWYEAMIQSINVDSEVGQEAELLYENVISGFSARLSKQHLESLAKADSATMDELYSLHTTHSPHFLGLEEGVGLWDAENLASDVIIGVVDTGIWPEHPSFRGKGLPPVPSHWRGKCKAGPKFAASNCNRKLVGAKAFFKGYEAIAGRVNETSDYRSPRDSQGHGTHTSSTAGGNLVKGANFLGLAKGTASGMRYTARIAAYKACYQLGCATSDIVAAMEQAVRDGVDVLSLSLGGPLGSSVSNIAPWMATVAASYMDRVFPARVELGDGQILLGTSLYSGKAPTTPLHLAYGDTAGGRGTRGARMAGGAGMILANGENQGEELLADAHVLPAASLGAAASKAVKMYSNSTTNATAVLTFDGEVYNSPAPVMAAFSSRWPSLFEPDIIKPDITAPGVNILAAWPPNISPTELTSDRRRIRFNIVSGTSMSCPTSVT